MMSTNPTHTIRIRGRLNVRRGTFGTHNERKKYVQSPGSHTHAAHEGFKERKDENCAEREERREINMFGIK